MVSQSETRKVLVTHSIKPNSDFLEQLNQLGHYVENVPTIHITSLDQGIEGISHNHWDWIIFISTNAVNYGIKWLNTNNARTKIAAVGARTAQALMEYGVCDVFFPKNAAGSEALLSLGVFANMASKRILIVAAPEGNPLLANELIAKGAQVSYFFCYQRSCYLENSALLNQFFTKNNDFIMTVASQKGFDCLLKLLNVQNLEKLKKQTALVISKRLANYLEHHKINKIITATIENEQGMLQALKDSKLNDIT